MRMARTELKQAVRLWEQVPKVGRKKDAQYVFLLQVLTTSALDVQGYSNLGLAYHRLGELSDAQDSFEKAIELEPNNAIVLTNLGLPAIVVAAHCCISLAYSCAINVAIGTLHAQDGEYELARKRFEEALAINPKHSDAEEKLKQVWYNYEAAVWILV